MKIQHFIIAVLVTLPFAQLLDAAKPSAKDGSTARREAVYQKQIDNRQKNIDKQQKLIDSQTGNVAQRQKIVERQEKQVTHLEELKTVASSPAGIKAVNKAAAYEKRADARQGIVDRQEARITQGVGNVANSQKIIDRQEQKISGLQAKATGQRQIAQDQLLAQNSRRDRGGQSASPDNSSRSEPRVTSRGPGSGRSGATRSGGGTRSSGRVTRSDSSATHSSGNVTRSSGSATRSEGSRSSGSRQTVRRVGRGGTSPSVSGTHSSGKQPARYARGGDGGRGGDSGKRGGGRGEGARPSSGHGGAKPAAQHQGHANTKYGPRYTPGRYRNHDGGGHHDRHYSHSPGRGFSHGPSRHHYYRPYHHRYYHRPYYHCYYYDSPFLRMYYYDDDFDFYFGVHRPYYSWYRFHYGWHHPYRPIYVYGVTSPVVIREYVTVSQPEVVAVQPESETYTTHEKLMGQLLFAEDEKRVEAAKELAEHKDISTVAALADALINDANYQVRAAAAESLGEIADPASYEVLLRSADAEQSETVQKAAQAAAENIGKTHDTDKLYVTPEFPPMNNGKENLGTYMEQLRFGSDDERKKAVKKLEDYPGTQAVATLINVLVNDPDKDVRKEAAHCLGEIGDRMPLPFLDAVSVNDPEKSVREEAKDAIEEIHETIR